MLEQLFLGLGWGRARMFYEKQFWATELHEAGFCKLLTNVGEKAAMKSANVKSRASTHEQ